MADMSALQSRSSLTPQASAELSGLGTRELALSQQLKNAEIRMKNYEAALAKMSPSERDLNQMTLELRRQNVATLRADLDQTHVRMQELLGDKPEQVKVQTNPLTNPLIVGEGPATVGTVGSYRPPAAPGKYKGAGVGPSPAYSYSAAVVEVEVDETTGVVQVGKI